MASNIRYMRRNGIQLAQPMTDKLLRRMFAGNDYIYAQPKLDGVRCRALVDPSCGSCVLLSSEEKIIPNLPHINAAVMQMWNGLDDSLKSVIFEFDGELYLHGKKFEEINSIVARKKNIHKDYESIEYHLFDLVIGECERIRRMLIDKLPVVPSIVKVVTLGARFDDVLTLTDRFISLGYEGIILRNPSACYVRKRTDGMLKFKPTKSDHYLIIDFDEAISMDGKHLNRVGSIVCIDHDNQNIFRVSAAFSHEEAAYIWRNSDSYAGKFAHVTYQNLTNGKNVPRFGRCTAIVDMAATEYTSI